MESEFKRIIKRMCPGILLRPALKLRSGLRNWRYLNRPVAGIFTEIYLGRGWGGESVSGMGSDFEQTNSVRQRLPGVLTAYSVRTLLDVPCGDFSWMQHTKMGSCRYIGADIVPALVEENSAKYSSAERRFCVLDIMRDPLPKADLVLCRDCLIHLSLRDAHLALMNVAHSGIPYLLTTNYPLIAKNTDIITGDFRAINLELSPFNLPKPLAILPEDLFPEHKDNPNFIRQLGLWRSGDIIRCLGK